MFVSFAFNQDLFKHKNSAPRLKRRDKRIKVGEVNESVGVEITLRLARLERDDELIKVGKVEEAIGVEVGRA